MLRFEDLRVRDRTDLDRDFFNRRYRLIAETFQQLNDGVTALSKSSDSLVAVGLTRINEVLGPALTQVQLAAESGFLVGTSSTPFSMADGLEGTMVIGEAERGLFAPTPFVILTRNADDTEDDWAVLRVQSYDRDNGGLAFAVAGVSGNIGDAEHDDWVVSASAGLAATILRVGAGLATALATAQDAAQKAEDASTTAQEVLANGPVSSVNGLTGIVALAMSDVPGLVAALAGKAPINVTDELDGGTF